MSANIFPALLFFSIIEQKLLRNRVVHMPLRSIEF